MRLFRSEPARFASRFRVIMTTIAVLTVAAAGAWAQADQANTPVDVVRVVKDTAGMRLQVAGEDFMVFGMNWGYMPIGQNYLYSLWTQPDEVIEEALAREMPLLQAMGVNAIRQYVGIQPRWVQYIYERYGIFTMINHPCARYGFTLDGVWTPSVDYSNPRLREAVKDEVVDLVNEFDGVPGMLMWLLGNENNYGLSWSSFEIEALPEGERNAARARHLYSLFGDIIRTVKSLDPNRPVAIANGDLQYIDIITEECQGLDIFGTNVYRGISSRDLFQVINDKMGVPAMYTEFGADAWNAKHMSEDQVTQARYLIGQWQEIYEQSSGKGRVGNAIGGFIFQWSDGWWKFGQDSRLDIHDTNASWPNAGYPEDFVEGENNMNEEWWGICAKGKPDGRSLYHVFPRAAYYALREAFKLDPYAPDTDIAAIRAHFAAVDPAYAGLQARGDRAALRSDATSRVRVSGLRLEFETFNTGGTNINTPPAEEPKATLPAFRGFDYMESFYVDFQAQPAQNVVANLSVSILGHVPVNPIDEIFYENRGRQRTIVVDGEPVDLQGLERLRVYRASVSWDDRWFSLEGFYRTGHLHWGHEGDFFGIYHDAYYGENIDIYNGEAPVGVEISAKRFLKGLKVAYGPQLWWGANPSYLVKYNRRLGPFDVTGIYQNEFAKQSEVTSSLAVPLPPTKRASLHVSTGLGPFTLDIGGLWSGSTKVGETFRVAEETPEGTNYFVDHVKDEDTYGGKAKLTLEKGKFRWYGEAAYFGIVADGGPISPITFTAWHLKDSGTGNNVNALTGMTLNWGNFQIGPNFLWQKPLVGPIPFDPPLGKPRNVLDDPFAVRGNREQIAAEMLISYDPTPATWMWAWDNDIREDAGLAYSVGLVFRHLPTTQDANIGVLADGGTFPFPGAPPPKDLWELRLRIISRLFTDTRLIAHIYGGPAQSDGSDPRPIDRFGFDVRMTSGSTALEIASKYNDWGPYDYHRNFNLTFPNQLMGDLSHALGMPRWFGHPQTRLGVRGTVRWLNGFSPRYCPGIDPVTGECDPTILGEVGKEWEIRTYLHVSL